MLRALHVRGDPDAHPQLPAGPHLARAAAHQRRHARGRVRGVPPALERHAVRVLHPRGHQRVHGRVSVPSQPPRVPSAAERASVEVEGQGGSLVVLSFVLEQLEERAR